MRGAELRCIAVRRRGRGRGQSEGTKTEEGQEGETGRRTAGRRRRHEGKQLSTVSEVTYAAKRRLWRFLTNGLSVTRLALNAPVFEIFSCFLVAELRRFAVRRRGGGEGGQSKGETGRKEETERETEEREEAEEETPSGFPPKAGRRRQSKRVPGAVLIFAFDLCPPLRSV